MGSPPLFYFGNIPQRAGEGWRCSSLDSGHGLYLAEGGSQISPANLGLEWHLTAHVKLGQSSCVPLKVALAGPWS